MKSNLLLKTVFSVLLVVYAYVFTHAQETIIQKNELPKNAQNFINKHFINKTINYIKKDKEVFLTDYEVKFTDLSEVKFDETGDWEEVDGEYQPIPTAYISNSIKRYVQSQFPETYIIKIEKKSLKQEVKISNGLELIFNNSGKFIRIDD